MTTVIVNIGVFIVMGYFLVKYRYDPNKKKAHFTHGNPRLEMAWTIAPAIILAFISLASKKVWDQYRFGDGSGNPITHSIAISGWETERNSAPGKDNPSST